MGWRTPRRIGLNRNESLVRPRLNPPWSTLHIHNNFLAGACSGHTACDGLNSLAAALCRWRDFGEFNGGSGAALPRMATTQHHTRPKDQRDNSFPMPTGTSLQCHLAPIVEVENAPV